MGRITTGTGLISGINSKDIIDQLMAIEERPKTRLQSQSDTLSAQKLAYNTISTNLSVLTSLSRSLQRPSTFTAAKATSTDDGILTATTTPGAAVGSYQFQVARLVTSQQSISTSGYADPGSAVKAGNVTIEMGGGNLDTETELSALNGGAGVRRGAFRVTDRSGKSSVIDIGAAVSLDDVIKKINTSLDVSVKAKIDGDKLVLTDVSGGTDSDLVVQDLGDGHAAEDLGIVARVSAGTITGTDFNRLSAKTALSSLNDGLGVRRKAGGPDLVVTAKNGSKTNVTFGDAVATVGDAIDAINQAAGGKFTAAIGPGGKGIRITDSSGGGGGSLSVADGAGSKAATDLGLAKSAAAGPLDGGRVQSGVNTVLLSSLNGGAGLATGKITIKDRSGTTKDVDLAGATTVQELLDKVNGAGLAVTASLNPAKNGIQIAGSGTGTGDLVIADKTGTTAADLGVAGTFAAATAPVAKGKNLQLKWVGETTLLSDYNGGKGVTPGSFRVTNSKGNQVVVDISDRGAVKSIGDVIDTINASGAGVTASVNEHGDGLLLTDAAGGAGTLKVENVSGTSAKDLNILGSAAAPGAGTIDGSFEKTIAVSGTDSLQSVADKIKAASFGATANVLNDGSGATPYRLSLTAYNSGVDGRVVFDAGTTGLDTQALVAARDAAVFVGGSASGSAEPLLVTSSTNQLSNVVAGVNIELHGAGTDPVTLNVARDADTVVDTMKKFVDNFNTVVNVLDGLTRYDTTTQKGGLLLGEGTAQQIQTSVYQAIDGLVGGAGRYNNLFELGISITSSADFAAGLADGTADATGTPTTTTNADGTTTTTPAATNTGTSGSSYTATLTFDEDKFRSALAADPEALKNVFTQLASGLNTNTPLAQLNDGRGVRVAGGGKPDFQIALQDGSKVSVALPGADGTVNDVVTAVTAAAGGKVTVSVNSAGTGLSLVDNTTGASTFEVTSQNGSAAAIDLGIGGKWPTGTAAGSILFPNAKKTGGGFGYLIEQKLNTLVDPTDGLIARQNNSIDSRNRQFTKRITDIDTLVGQKRARLEKQFANMESVLAKLQSQQSALSGLSA